MTGAAPVSHVRHSLEERSDGTLVVHAVQDVEPILDLNKAMATHNDGYSPSRELRRVASVPNIVIEKWLTEHGFWFYDAFTGDEAAARKLRQLLNDPQYSYLRTAPGRL